VPASASTPTVTVTFVAAKLGFESEAARRRARQVVVAGIGVAGARRPRSRGCVKRSAPASAILSAPAATDSVPRSASSSFDPRSSMKLSTSMFSALALAGVVGSVGLCARGDKKAEFTFHDAPVNSLGIKSLAETARQTRPDRLLGRALTQLHRGVRAGLHQVAGTLR
jgi:hypothetical protein